MNQASKTETSTTRGTFINMLFLFVLVFVFTGMIFLYTLRNIRHADLLYDISMLQKEKEKIRTEIENLRINVAAYSTPDRIEKLYRDRMGYFPLRVGNRIQTLKLPSLGIDESDRENLQSPSGVSSERGE